MHDFEFRAIEHTALGIDFVGRCIEMSAEALAYKSKGAAHRVNLRDLDCLCGCGHDRYRLQDKRKRKNMARHGSPPLLPACGAQARFIVAFFLVRAKTSADGPSTLQKFTRNPP